MVELTAVSTDSEHPMDLYDRITQAFADSFINGRVDTAKFGYAVTLIAPLYDRILGEGHISNRLKSDIIGHGVGLTGAAERDSRYKYIDEMVPTMVRETGIDGLRHYDCSIVCCLWTKRALDFMLRFLEYGILTCTDCSLQTCAHRAYHEVLKPYHGFIVSTVANLALHLAPRRDKFLVSLGFLDLYSAQEKLKPFVFAVKPVVDTVDRVLRDNNCDFPEKV